MIQDITVHPGRYHDSAFLMRLSREIQDLDGVKEAVIIMATEMNQELLRDAGFPPPTGTEPVDLVVALRVRDHAALHAAQAAVQAALRGEQGPKRAADQQAHTLDEALAQLDATPAHTIVSIAVPGTYAAWEAHRALDAGCHVFLFSDNVTVADELELKRRGAELDRLVMGPDCGTAIIAGTRLGFANRVERGPVGLLGPSGTGIQELCCGLDALGVGISHAIGTGSRDLHAEVGGAMTRQGLAMLVEDDDTQVIVLVAKPPAPQVAAAMHDALSTCGKPAVVRFLGQPRRAPADGVFYASTLDEAVAQAAKLAAGITAEAAPALPADTLPQGRLVGLFGGGSLATEARELLRRAGIATDTPTQAWLPGQPLPPGGHILVDVGDDRYTRGRPHPMIDQAARLELMEAALGDPGVSLLLLDLVLGDGAHADPAPELAELIQAHPGTRVICSVSGTRADPQDTRRQREVMRLAGATVCETATRAATVAAHYISHGGAR